MNESKLGQEKERKKHRQVWEGTQHCSKEIKIERKKSRGDSIKEQERNIGGIYERVKSVDRIKETIPVKLNAEH